MLIGHSTSEESNKNHLLFCEATRNSHSLKYSKLKYNEILYICIVLLNQ